MFFKHFASKNQLPGLSISGTLVENGLNNLKDFDNTKLAGSFWPSLFLAFAVANNFVVFLILF